MPLFYFISSTIIHKIVCFFKLFIKDHFLQVLLRHNQKSCMLLTSPHPIIYHVCIAVLRAPEGGTKRTSYSGSEEGSIRGPEGR